GDGVGLALSAGDFESNLVAGNGGDGVVVNQTDATVVRGNTVASNRGDGLRVGGYAYGGSQPDARGDNLVRQRRDAGPAPGGVTIDAAGSWFGIADPAVVDALVRDAADDSTLGLVSYQPLARGPVAGAPVDQGAPAVPSLAASTLTVDAVDRFQLAYTATLRN